MLNWNSCAVSPNDFFVFCTLKVLTKSWISVILRCLCNSLHHTNPWVICYYFQNFIREICILIRCVCAYLPRIWQYCTYISWTNIIILIFLRIFSQLFGVCYPGLKPPLHIFLSRYIYFIDLTGWSTSFHKTTLIYSLTFFILSKLLLYTLCTIFYVLISNLVFSGQYTYPFYHFYILIILSFVRSSKYKY